MKLNDLLKTIQPVRIAGGTNIEITGINIDSRLVEAGHLFMAMRHACVCSWHRIS